MTTYGNTPFPIANARIRQKRKYRRRRVGVAIGASALFGTRRGKGVLGRGLKAVGRVSPLSRKILTKDIRRGYKIARRAKATAGAFARAKTASGVYRLMSHRRTAGATMRGLHFLSNARTWLKAIPRL